MAETLPDNFCPYAPGASVMKAIDAHRDHGLADPVTSLVLGRIGVPDTMNGRTRAALQFLGLIDDQGNHGEAFGRLRRATTEEFPGLLAEIIQAAYQPVLVSVNIATADATRLSDAFRGFEPQAQRGKMVALFRVLAARAGLLDAPRHRGAGKRTATPARPRVTTVTTSHSDEMPTLPPLHAPPLPTPPSTRRDYRLIASVFERLPDEGRWSAARRARWLQLVAAAVDELVEVVEASPLSPPQMFSVAASPGISGFSVVEAESADDALEGVREMETAL